jgi:CRP-like cAMP-binding protein
MLEAMLNAPLVLKSPEPAVIIKGFGGSSVDYSAQFWIEDYGIDFVARDQVRMSLWYTFRRHGIEIPWPIQVEYSRTEQPIRSERHIAAAAERLAGVDLFSTLDSEARHNLSLAADEQLFAPGEAIVRQDAEGDSMFVLLRGRVRVVLEPSGQEVAVIPPGGFFGEMSMLTGDRRTATVRAAEDVTVLEISSADFRDLAIANPNLIDHVSTVMANRRVGLDDARAAAAASAIPEAKHNFLARVRRFLTLPK